MLTMDKANELFNWLANMSDIAYKYAPDGCYARAHLMCLRMENLKITTYKIWAFAWENGRLLEVKTRNHPDGVVNWSFHVAPLIRVNLNETKKTCIVLDPSLFDKPVTPREWREIQSPYPDKLPYSCISRFGQAPLSRDKTRYPGTGYWTKEDPVMYGITAHAHMRMAEYKRMEGQY